MALYKVTEAVEGAKPRLVEANSAAAALRHVATDKYTVETMANPTEIAHLMAGGVTLETVGAKPDPASSSGKDGDGSHEGQTGANTA